MTLINVHLQNYTTSKDTDLSLDDGDLEYDDVSRETCQPPAALGMNKIFI